MRTTRYLDELRERGNFKNDTLMGEFLGVQNSTISQYRHGKTFMSNDVCLKIADALGMESPVPIIVATDMDRAEKAGEPSLWEKFRLTATATVAASAVR